MTRNRIQRRSPKTIWRRRPCHSPAVGAVQVGGADEVEFGVDPVDAIGGEVERDAVGPADALVDDDGAVRAVHAGALDPRVLPPVGPEEPTLLGVDGDGARLLEL